MHAEEVPAAKRKLTPQIDSSLCLGCGVCALHCPNGSCQLTKREQRVIHPESTFERLMLQCLERGTLQNQLFANPRSINHIFMRAFVGAFLKLPPIKKALLSDKLRSGFLHALKEGARKQGQKGVLEM